MHRRIKNRFVRHLAAWIWFQEVVFAKATIIFSAVTEQLQEFLAETENRYK
jgi:hypothetical protein